MPTPRLIPGQGNFFAELTPQIPLDPSIVFVPSPTEDPRLAPFLTELTTTRYFGLDLQYYGPWTKIADIDYTKAIIRLIQIGLPSGLTLIIDLGAITSNRPAIQQHPQVIQALQALAIALRATEQLKIGQALKGHLVALECNLGLKVRSCRDLMLFSQVLWAGVGAAKPKKPKGRVETPEERQARLKFVGLKHSLQAISYRCGIDTGNLSQVYNWEGKLDNSQINWAARKVQIVLPVWRKLATWVREADLIDSVLSECEALPAFAECEYHGLPVDYPTLVDAISKWTKAKLATLEIWHSVFPGVDPQKKEKVAVALSAALGLTGGDRLYSLGEPGKNGKRKIIPRVNDETLVPYDTSTPGNLDPSVPKARQRIYHAVHAYLEHNSIHTQLAYLLGFQKRYQKGYVRPKFFQIAMSHKPGKEDETGKGMGRASAYDPNTTNCPNLQEAHKKAGLPGPRSVVKPKPGHGLIGADLSNGHARLATQASLDPALIQIFSSGGDAHCNTSIGLLKLRGVDLDYETVFKLYSQAKKYTKAVERGELPAPIPQLAHDVAATRILAKPVFFGSLNLQGPPTLKKTAETGAEPVFMTLEQAAEGIQVWRVTYAGLYAFQRRTIKEANQHKVRFDLPGKIGSSPYHIGQPGEYAVVRGLSKRRLFLLKETDKHGRFSCKGTDCVSFVWMGTEADVIKRAMGRIQATFDQQPEWGAAFGNMCHDEINIECYTEYENEVAQCVQKEFDSAMQWVIKVIPVSDGDWKSMIVGSWAAK